jgi:RNA polymerase sigma factor FliA
MYAEFTESEVQTRVTELASRVRRIAHQMAAALPASVELDDLIQSGMMGLLDAARRYQSKEGAQFETYAVQRIRGAIVDGLRQCDWAPRSVRASRRRLDSTISRLEQQNGRAPTDGELAEAFGMRLQEYQRFRDETLGHPIVSYEDLGGDEDDSFLARYCVDAEGDPLKMLEVRKLREALVEAIEDLPDREKLVMSLYYEQELNLAEIGETLGVSESRVCQIHRQSIARLRARVDTAQPPI